MKFQTILAAVFIIISCETWFSYFSLFILLLCVKVNDRKNLATRYLISRPLTFRLLRKSGKRGNSKMNPLQLLGQMCVCTEKEFRRRTTAIWCALLQGGRSVL